MINIGMYTKKEYACELNSEIRSFLAGTFRRTDNSKGFFQDQRTDTFS